MSKLYNNNLSSLPSASSLVLSLKLKNSELVEFFDFSNGELSEDFLLYSSMYFSWSRLYILIEIITEHAAI